MTKEEFNTRKAVAIAKLLLEKAGSSIKIIDKYRFHPALWLLIDQSNQAYDERIEAVKRSSHKPLTAQTMTTN